MTLYKVLGVKKTASRESIRKAYRKRAMQAHPDRGGDAERFREVNLVYSVLSDDARRARYDETGEFDIHNVDNSHAETMSILSQCLNETLSQLVQAGLKPEQEDLIARMQASLKGAREKQGEEINNLEHARRTFQSVAGRFTVKDNEPNFLELSVQQSLMQVENAIRAARHSMDAIARAADFLKLFGFRADPKKVEVYLSEWMTASEATVRGYFKFNP